MKNFTHSIRLLTLLTALFVTSASVMAQTVLFSESFANFAAGEANGSAATADVSAKLNEYTSIPGWSGAKVYEAGGSAKMGSSSALGWIQTPALDLSASGGNGVIKFEAMAWKGDATEMKVTVNGVVYTVPNLPNTEAYVFSSFEVPVTGLNAATTIKFEGKQASKGRFFLKNLVVEKGAATTTPTVTVAGNTYFGNLETGASVSQTYVVKGSHLTGDLTVAITGTGYSAVKTTLPKAEVESEAGCEITVDLLASVVGNQEGTMTISGGGLAAPEVMNFVASVFETVKCASLSEVLAKDKSETIYEITGEVLIHFVNGANVYLHDASTQTLLYNNGNVIDNALIAAGHHVKGLKVKVDEYYKIKQLIPVALDEVVSTGNVLPEAQVTTVEEMVANPAAFAHKLIVVHNVTMEQKPFTAADLNNTVTGEGGATLNCYDKYKVLDGFTPKAEKLSLHGIASVFKEKAQIQPRSTEDITTTVSNPALDAASVNVYAANGNVVVETESASRVEIFNTVGQAVKVVTVESGVSTISVAKGLYIIRVNGKATKVLVR